MRFFCLCSLLAAVGIVAGAQTPPPPASGPTTRILAIGHLPAASTSNKIAPLMQQEVQGTVRLYLAGKLDQWFSRRDQRGVVFLLNVSTVEEARRLLEGLPLGSAKLLEFDFIPLGPLSPLQYLLSDHPGAAK